MTSRVTKKYVVTITCTDDGAGALDFHMDRALKECLATMSHKRFKLPQFQRADVDALKGVRLASVNLAEAVAESIEEKVREAIWSHEDERDHEPIDTYGY